MNLPSLCALSMAVAALAACDSRDDGKTVGQKVDETIASAKSAAGEAKETAQRGLDKAAQVTQEKAAEVGEKAGDATITAAIKAGLAKDPELSALRINVDTQGGRVALYGSAPNEAARQRAQTIAQNEKGVTAVDNKLTVEAR